MIQQTKEAEMHGNDLEFEKRATSHKSSTRVEHAKGSFSTFLSNYPMHRTKSNQVDAELTTRKTNCELLLILTKVRPVDMGITTNNDM